KPDSIGRGYDGTTDGGTIPIDLTFTDGTNEIKLKEGTGFTAKKTFDSADAGWHTVTVEIELIGEAAVKYKLKAGEEKFEIGGNINKAYPKLTVSLSQTTCTVGEKLLPLLSVSGVQENAAVTYYYAPINSGYLEFEGSEAVPAIDENTAISDPGTYYVYAKTAETKNYEEERSTTVELTVTEPAAASVTKADGTVSGTYKTLPAALNAAQDGDTVKLLADHTTNWSDVEAGEYATLAVVRKTLTLDLNGMTVDYLTVGEVVPDEEGGILESYDGNLTVVDNIQGGSCGKIKDLEFVKGSLAIQGGRIGDSLTCDGNSGTVTISGGTVCNATVGDGAAVTVTGGTGHAGTWYNDGTLKITDGTFGNVKFLNNGGTIAISGGTFGTITNINGSSSIPLMPLLADNYAFYQGDNAQNSTEKTLTNVTVRPHTHSFENGKCDCGVAAIVVDNNNSCYNTLQAALGAAADDASITSVTLGQDLTEDVTFNRSAAESLTLNMNGHKLETEAGVPLTVTGGTLRIEGAGEINQNTASNATAFPAIKLTGGKLVIAGDLTAQGGYDSSSGRKPAIYATDGELDLQGNVSLNGGLTILDNAKLTNLLTKGTFYAQDPDGKTTKDNVLAVYVQQEDAASDNYNTVLKLIADGYAIYKADDTVKNASTLTLNSDTYSIGAHTCNYNQDEAYGIAYCKCGRSHAHRDLSEEKSVLVNGICPICGYHCPHNTVDETTLSCSDCGAKVVAKVEVEGSEPTYAFDLASAFQNAVNGTTIKLLANAMLPDGIYASKTLTLDLNGHSLSGYSLNVGGLTAMSQVRTGKLTVIDSSGGNGAVGVTVRDGGTLVFDPKNDHTTLLQLEVWGGTVELCGGKISRSGLRLHNGITLGDLLPQKAGLAYYRGGTQLTLEEATSQTCDLVVKSCSHGGKNGFDKSATTCPYCGAPAVAETALNNGEGNRLQRRFADLQTALDADRDGGATLKLLADVTGNYTINGTQDTGLDLNGHSIKGTVTVKTAAGSNTTTLSNTKNMTTVSIDNVVAYKGAKLAGSGKPAVIGTLTLAEGATWKTILNDTALGYKMLNADGTHKWYARDDVKGSQLNNVIINRLPITSKTLYLKVDGKNLTKVERGTTVQLCASCNAKDVTVTFSILKTGETTPITLSGNDVQYTTVGTGTTKFYVAEYAFNDVGSYTISFTATKDGYTVTSTPKKLTVTKPNLSNAEITFPNGNEAAFNSVTATGVPTFVVKYNGTELEENVDFVITSGDSTYDVGPCTLTIKATDNGDYTGSKSAEWTVRPLKVAASVGDIIKTYDGTTDLPANAKITFKSADSYYTGITLRLAKGTDYEVLNAHYDSADASTEEKTVSFTIKLKNPGYVFEDDTTQKDFTLNGADFDDKTFQINKATAPMNNPTGTLNIINGTCQTYTYDFNNILPGLPGGKYGTISYGQADISLVSQSGYYYDETIVEFKKGVLTLAQFYAKDGKMTGRIGTVKVNVTTTNYADFQLKLVLNAVDQIKPEPDGTITASEITYGDTLSKSEISGKMKDPNTGDAVNGTFTWTDGTIKPDANDNYEAEWTFTPAAGYEKYATVTGTVTVKVAPKSIEGATITLKKREFTYNAAEQSPTITGVMLKGWSETITTYDIVSGDKAINANDSITLTIKGTGNYTGTATAEWKIIPAKLTVSVPSEVKKEYDGTTNATVTPTFNGLRGKDNLTAADYSVTAAFDNAKVGYKKTVIGKVTLNQTETAKNYVLTNDGNFSTDDGTITKAVAPTVQPVELTIYNGVQADYYVDLPSLPDMGKGKSYGTVGYRKTHTINLSEGYKAQSDLRADPENLNTLRLLLHMTQTGSLTGEIGTVTIPVTTSNYQDITLTVKISAKNRITPTGTPTLSKNAIIYGDALNTIALSGKLHDNVNNVDVDGTFEWVDGTHIPVVGNGTYAAEWIFEPTDTEKYLTVSGRSNITVEKARQYGKLSMAGYTYGKTPSTPTLTDQTGDLNAQVTYSYAAADSGSVQTWDISNPPALNAGTYRMYASIGDTDNYYGFEVVYCEFVVAKATPTYTVPTGLTAKYGQTLADVTLPDGWSWMDSSESVGGASTAAKTFQAKFTPKDTENYNTVENIELEVTVNKADGGNLKTVELEQKYTDASDHTYTPDWAGLPAGQDWTFSSEASIVLPKQDFAADGNLLTYAISGGKAGDKITLILKASCDNYEDFTITLNVTLTEKDDQKPLTITGNTSVIYGEKLTLTTTGGSGMGAVTYRIDNAISTGEATIDPNTGVLTPVKVGSVSVIATKAGDNNYNDVTSAPFVLMIKPATPTGEPKYTKITTSGKTLKDVTLTIEGSTLNPSDGKLEWVDDKGEPLPDDTTVKANTTYKWCFTPDDDNYTTLTGEVELYHKSSSGDGWYDSYYTIKATAGAGGSISPSGNVSVREGGDQTFTITPDKGYAVANVKIDGKSIGAVKSYTFENVSSPHTIEAIFVKGTASASTGDSSNLPLWSALLLASTLALAGAVHLKRKRAR
ncbi:YDG domain-containing protein, partial [Hominenteromicrobium sp.]|uniref:YDG domain-containing protein n=1 Tax=Hominenteromicrobium sp. TaxID=3073581 RepID=UPI003999D065